MGQVVVSLSVPWPKAMLDSVPYAKALGTDPHDIAAQATVRHRASGDARQTEADG